MRWILAYRTEYDFQFGHTYIVEIRWFETKEALAERKKDWPSQTWEEVK